MQGDEEAVEQGDAVGQSVLCKRCGYALQGLNREGTCPECGVAIACSLLGDALEFEDPRWMRRLAWGVVAGIGAILGLIATTVFSLILQISQVGFSRPDDPLLILLQVIFTIVYSVNLILTVAGTWLITTPSGTEMGQEQTVNVRKSVRWLSVAYVIGITALASLSWASTGSNAAWITLYALSELVWLVVLIALAIHLRHLVKRSAYHQLSLQFVLIAVAVVPATVIEILTYVVFSMYWWDWLSMASQAVWLIVLAWILAIAIILFRRFSVAAQYARLNWSAEAERYQ